MDTLKQIVQSFSEDEAKQIKKQINYRSFRKDRKDVKLFNLLRSKLDLSSADIQEKIYESNQKAAYHQLRKALHNHIETFIKQHSFVTDEVHNISNQISIAKYLFNMKLSRQGWKYLIKAETLAKETEQYILLNYIYQIQIENSYHKHAPDINMIIEKRNKNIQFVDQDDSVNVVFNLLEWDLRKAQTVSLHDIEEKFNKYLPLYKVKVDSENTPKLEYLLTLLIGRVMFEKQEFEKLDIYIKSKYKSLISRDVFGKHNHLYKIRFLEIIVRTFLRIRNYSESEKYYEFLKEELQKYEKMYYNLIVSLSPILSDIYNCTGRNTQSINLLESILNNPPYQLSLSDEVVYKSNIAALYYENKEFSKAIHSFMLVRNQEKLIIKMWGNEAALKIQLAECIIHTDAGNDSFVLSRIKSIRRKFADILNTDNFQREELFIHLLNKINYSPEKLNSKSFLSKAYLFLRIKKTIPGDPEIISFNAWIKSKIEKRNYYEVFLELVQ